MSQDQDEQQKIDPIRQTSPEAIRLAKTLIRIASYGALAVLDQATGFPLASRVAVATDSAGAPVILISSLSAHSKALMADCRCSLLLGEPGKGDPVAHPRITLICKAQWLEAGTPETSYIRERYLRRQPKASLYAGFGDFSFVRLQPLRANLNGGFGKAYTLCQNDLTATTAKSEPASFQSVNQKEAALISAINQSCASLVAAVGKREFPAIKTKWTVIGLDEDGFDLMSNGAFIRIWLDDLEPSKISLIKQIQWVSSH